MNNIVAIILGLCLPVSIVIGLMVNYTYKTYKRLSKEDSNQEDEGNS